MLRIALRVDGSVGLEAGDRDGRLRVPPGGATSGPMRMPSTTPIGGAERTAAAEQEGVLARAGAHRLEPACAAAAARVTRRIVRRRACIATT